MPLILQMVGAFLVALVILFMIAMIWFHLVEGIRNGVKKRLFPPKEPAVWHSLEEAQRQKENKNT